MKILITPRSFGKFNEDEIMQIFENENIEVIRNPYGRIMTEEEMIHELSDKDGVIVGVDPLNKNVLSKAPHLKAIAKYGVGTDNIDMDFTKTRDISVSRTLDSNSEAVADYAFALLMACARKVVEINNSCKAGDWSKEVALDIYGKKIGVLGLGAIGKGVVRRAKGFNMDVYAYDIFEDKKFIDENDITFTDVDTIIRECDFISLHLPLTPDTENILNKENLKNAKNHLIIINTARGGLINEDDLYDFIVDNKIYGAGLDVFAVEPPSQSKLLELDQVIVGSHTAASTIDAVNLMSMMSTKNIIRDLKGEKS